VKLPNVEKADVPERKLVDYLLAPEHRSGQTKAAFFRVFQYTRENWRALAEALHAHAGNHEVTATRPREAGMLYVIEGPLSTPDGRTPWVRCIWCIDEGEDIPRFITAYPMPRTIT
jgi:hypothetical protein